MVKKTHPAGRDSGTGQFIPVAVAKRRKKTAVVEQVPNPGRGLSGPAKKRPKKK